MFLDHERTHMETVKTKQDVIARLVGNGPRIRQLGVVSLSLFGSFVRDEAGVESDVDMIVEFAQGSKSFDHFMELSFLLEDLLGRRVELLTPASLSPHMGDRILREAEHVPLAA